ncbi:hypothetical protein OG840_20035 [Streptomyces sp. NBC_01764]|uniref:hypothetical protein n=1 Tax=Streptomyces sp. NBC_01764 TaxID=2975935 RepID=UPI0022577B1D|nr:hypothetical protein [Streptomyces sp. NBC_01764]MCX4403977.1 hypothetical protein [Streptomyces sp. NBC_01764]
MRNNRHHRTTLLLIAALAAGPVPLVVATTAHAAAADCPQNDTQCDENEKDQKETAKERQDVNDSIKDARKDIAKAQNQVDACKPESADCMKKLAGDGAQEKEGIEHTSQELAGFRGAPTDNASTAVAGACDTYAAALPVSGTDAQDFTALCEVMAR